MLQIEKLCKKCNKILPIDNFSKKKCNKDGLQPSCKQCYKEYISNLTKNRILNGNCAGCGKPNPDGGYICTVCKIPRYASYKRYSSKESSLELARNRGAIRRKKPSYLLRVRDYQRMKYATDENYRLENLIRCRLRCILRHNSKKGKAIQDLGCSVDKLREYLENQFLPGMTWDNRGCHKGEWGIDHIIPIESVDLSDKEQYLSICHYTNLRPMWHVDNITRRYKERHNVTN
jgi:hypothetical protein